MLSLALTLSALVSYSEPVNAAGSSLTFSPNHGDYIVGNTFEVSLLLNTNGESINTIEANVNFSPDKIQVVAISKSVIEIWIAQPSFSNTAGTISLVGGIPTPGLNTSAGVVTTVTFRAKSAGVAKLAYDTSSKILKNDGNGTSILTSRGDASFNIDIAPPAGPVVSSKTHDDQNKWYNNGQVTFEWDRPDGATDFSYIFDNNPTTIPDETIETSDTSISLTAANDGLWYFHIRGKNKVWGGTTHYLVRIDNGPPAKFTPDLRPHSIDASGRAILTFRTTDAISGIDHYEVKLISSQDNDGKTTIFTEQVSPYVIQNLPKGSYKVVVRAIDKAGNYSDGDVSMRVTNLLFGLSIEQLIMIVAGLLLAILLALLLLWLRRRHHYVTLKQISSDLINVREQMKEKTEELQALQQVEKQSLDTITDLAHPIQEESTPPLVVHPLESPNPTADSPVEPPFPPTLPTQDNPQTPSPEQFPPTPPPYTP